VARKEVGAMRRIDIVVFGVVLQKGEDLENLLSSSLRTEATKTIKRKLHTNNRSGGFTTDR
jgi:hypothetical protein